MLWWTNSTSADALQKKSTNSKQDGESLALWFLVSEGGRHRSFCPLIVSWDSNPHFLIHCGTVHLLGPRAQCCRLISNYPTKQGSNSRPARAPTLNFCTQALMAYAHGIVCPCLLGHLVVLVSDKGLLYAAPCKRLLQELPWCLQD